MIINPRIHSSRDLLEEELEKIFLNRPFNTEYIDFILGTYSENWRTYHNCDHILKMLWYLEESKSELGLEANYIEAIRLMIVYHDVVYKLKREPGWNERESACIAGKQLDAMGYKSPLIELVVDGIECTIDHKLPEALQGWHDYIAPFLDIDLMVGLGPTWEACQENTRLIGEEYSPVYTPGEYEVGRASFAGTFLLREKIFHSKYFSQYEAVVRENLDRMSVGS